MELEEANLQSYFEAAIADARKGEPRDDAAIASQYAELFAGDDVAHRAAWPHLRTAEVVSAGVAALLGLGGVVFAARQFAAATALYGFYPAGSHGRLVLAAIALVCLGVVAGVVLHVMLGMWQGLYLLAAACAALILASVFAAIYTGPSGMTLEYTSLMPSGGIAALSVCTAAAAAVAAISAIASTLRPT